MNTTTTGATRALPFTPEQIEAAIATHPTPFHLYDEAGIRATARALREAFAWTPVPYRNYYAVKALPNPHIMRIVAEEGMGFDCSSAPELMLAEKIGTPGEEIMFSSNDTPIYEYEKAKGLGAMINLDDITHIEYIHERIGLPDLVCVRYNPGALKQGNSIIGDPQDAKYGFTREQIFAGYRRMAKLGVKKFALHTMVASNELDPEYFVETARILFELAVEIHKQLGIAIEFVNLGGGVGIPYRPEQSPVDLQRMSAGIKDLYGKLIAPTGARKDGGLHPLPICTENGRVVTGPHGYLITRARHIKNTYKRFVGLDASMANLMRPGMYGAYHHVTVLGKEQVSERQTVDVTGSLCENNDKFAIDRELPPIEPGDIVVIHDTGAHGHSMGFNYNGKLRSAELLLRPDGTVKLIRRAETVEDYFATLQI